MDDITKRRKRTSVDYIPLRSVDDWKIQATMKIVGRVLRRERSLTHRRAGLIARAMGAQYLGALNVQEQPFNYVVLVTFTLRGVAAADIAWGENLGPSPEIPRGKLVYTDPVHEENNIIEQAVQTLLPRKFQYFFTTSSSTTTTIL